MLDFTFSQRLLSRSGWGLFASAMLLFASACSPDCADNEREVDGECVAAGPTDGTDSKDRVSIALDSNSSNGVADNGKIDFNLAYEYEITATVAGKNEGFDSSLEGLPIVFSYDGQGAIFTGTSTRTVNTNANGIATLRVTATTDERNRIITALFEGDDDIAKATVTAAVNFCAECEVTSPTLIDEDPDAGPTNEAAQAAIRGFAFEGPFFVGEGETAVLVVEAFDDAGAVLPGVDVYISVNDPLQLKTALDPVKGPNGLATTDADGRIRISVTPRQGAAGAQTILAQALRPDGSSATATRIITISSNRAPTNILFTATPQTIQPSNANEVALEAIVLDDLGHPMPAAHVTFEIVAGPGADKSMWGYVEESATQEGANGALATYFAGTATGTVTIQVSTMGAAGALITKTTNITVSTSAPASVTNSAEDQAQDLRQLQTAMLAIQPEMTVVRSDGTSQIGIDIKPLGSGNQALQDVIVQFSISGGTMPADQRGSITPAQDKSDTSGTASLVYTAGTVAGTVTILAEVRLKTTNALVASNSVVLTLSNEPIEVLQVASISGVASMLSLEPLSPDPARITAYPLDGNGLLVDGDFVTFTLLTAGDAGRLVDSGANEIEYYAGSVTGLIDIQMCAGTFYCDTVQIDVQPDTGLGDIAVQDAIQQSAAYLNLTAVGSAVVLSGTGNSLLLNAQVMDASNGVVKDAIVSYSLTAGPSGNRADWGAVDVASRTGANGVAQAVYYSAALTGTVTVEATIRSVPSGAVLLTDTLVVQVDAATNAADQAQDLIQQQTTMLDILPVTTIVQNDGVSQIDIVVKPIGSANQTLADVIVDFSISGGSMAAAQRGSITPGQAVSNDAGITSLVYTAGTVAGTVTVQAQVRLKTTGALLVSNSVVLTLVSQPIEVLQVASISGAASMLGLEPQSPDPAIITAYPLNVDGLLVEGDFVSFRLLTAGDAGRLVDTGDNTVDYYAGTVTGPIDIQLCAGAVCDTVQIVVQADTGLGDLAVQEAIQQSAAYLNLTSVGPAVVLSGPANTLVLNAQVMSSVNAVVPDAVVTYSLTAGPSGNRADWGAIDVQSRTGADGIADAVYYGAALTGSVTVEATVRSVISGAILLTDTLVVQVDSAPSSDQTAEVTALILTSSRVSVKPGFANTVEISAQALNATNNPLTELFVYFDLETGPTGDRGEWGSILSRGEPDAQGVASTTYYAGTATGDVWVRARAGSVTEYLKLTVDVNAGDTTGPGGSSVEQEARQSNVAALVMVADNDNLPLGPSHSTQIHVWPIGSDNTPQPSVIVSFSVVTGPTLVAQSDWGMIDGNATTGANGKASVTYLAGNFAGPVTVRAQARSVLDATIYAEAYYTLNLQSAQSDAEARTQTLHLVAEPATVEQNSAEPIVIRGIALDSNNALIDGDFIEFALIEPGTPAQVGYIAKGTEDNTVLYYPGSQTGGITLEARANGLTQTIDAFVVVPATISPDALQASVTRLILTKSAPSVDQGPTHTMDILAWAVNASNNPLTGVKVNFAVISGPTGDPANWGGVEQEASTTNGLATAEYFAGFETGTVTIRAWVARITDASVVTQTTVDIPVVAAEVADETPYVDSIIMRLAKTEVQPGFSNSVDVDAMVLNALGNPLNNVTVDFRLVSGPAGPQSGWGAIQTSVNPTGGVAKTKYFAGSATGAVTIEASVGGISTQAVITITNNAVTVDTNSIAQEALQSTVSALVVTLDKTSLNVGPSNVANVRVFPIGSDSTPVLGAKVGFTILSATSGTRPEWGVIEGSATTTNGSGSVNYYAGTTASTVTIQAFVRSVTDANIIYATQNVTIDLLDPLPAEATVVDIALSLEEGMVLPGVTNKIKVWAQPINAFGNPVENIPVTFALISGPTGSIVDWGSIEGSANSDGGVAEVLYTAGSVTGAVEIQASVGGVIVSTFVNVVLQLPADDTDIQVQEARQRAAAFIALSADPAVVNVPSDAFATIEAFVLTSNNNLLDGVTVEFQIAGSTFVSQADWGGITAEGDTDTSGKVQVFYVPADVPTAGTVTIEATVRSVTNPTEILLTQTMLLTVQPVQDDSAAVASLAFFASGLVIEPGESLDLNAVALDVNNNPLSNLSIAFAVTGGTALNPEDWGFVGGLAIPAADGIATTTFQASQTTGYVWVDATVGAVTRTLQIQIAGPTTQDDTASVASIILAASSTEVAPGLGNAVQLSAMAVDAQGRPLRNVVFDFEILNASAVSGAVDFSGVPGSADGIATATYRAGSALGPVAIRATVGAVTAQLSLLVTDTPTQEPVDDATQQAVQTVVVLANPSTYVLGEDTSSDISILTLGANNVALDDVVVDLAITAGPGSNDNWGLIESRVVSSGGVASANYRLPQLTGAVTIEAYVRSVTDFSIIATSFTTVNVVNPTVAVDDTPFVANLIIAASAIEVAPGLDNHVQLSAMAVDALGRPLRNLVIGFEILSPDAVSGALDGSGVPSQTDGIATATYYAGSALGMVAIRATVGAFSAQVGVQITNSPNQSPANDSAQQAVQTLVVLANPDVMEVGFDQSTDVKILTLGANNIGIDDVVVDLAITNGPGSSSEWGYIDGSVMSNNGIATASYYSPLTTGTITIEAYVRSVTDFSTVATSYTVITVEAPTISMSGESDVVNVADIIVEATPSVLTIGANTISVISATAIDSLGHPLKDLTIYFDIPAANAVSGSVDASDRPNSSSGEATALFRAPTSPIVVPIVVTAGALQKTINVEVTTSTAARPEQEFTQMRVQTILFSSAKSQVGIGGNDTSGLTIVALDGNNNTVSGAQLTAFISNGPGLPGEWGYISLGGAGITSDGLLGGLYTSGLTTGTVTLTVEVRSVTDNTVYGSASLDIDLALAHSNEAIQAQVARIIVYRVENSETDVGNPPVFINTPSAAGLLARTVDTNGNLVDATVDWTIVSGPGAPDTWGYLSGMAENNVNFNSRSGVGTVTVQAAVRLSLGSSAVITSTTIDIEVVDDPTLLGGGYQVAFMSAYVEHSVLSIVGGRDKTQVFIDAFDANMQHVSAQPEVTILYATPTSGSVDVLDDVGGYYGTYYSVGSVTGTVTLQVRVGSIIDTVDVLVTNTPPVSVDDSIQQAVQSLVVVANPAQMNVGVNGETELRILTLGANNVALDGVIVDLAITAGPGSSDNWGLIAASATSVDGVAEVSYGSALLTGSVTIEAYVRSVTDFSQIATGFTTVSVVDPNAVPADDSGLVANLILTSNKTEVAPGLDNTVGFSAMAVDALGQPLRNLSITYEILAPTAVSGAIDGGTGTPGANGIATATYYAGTGLGVVTIRATVGAVSATRNILVTNTPNPTTADDSGQQAVQSVVVLSNPSTYVLGEDTSSDISVLTLGANNVALDGVIVDLAITNGPGASTNWGLIDSRAVSDNGVASASYRLPQLPGTVTIEAYVRSVTDFSLIATNSTTITIVNPGATLDDTPFVANLILAASAIEVAPGLDNHVLLSAMAVDALGRPLRNLVIGFEILSPTAVSGALDGSGVPSQTDGIATATYYAGSALGSVAIRATVGAFSAQVGVQITNSPNQSPANDSAQQAVQTLVVLANPDVMEVGFDQSTDVKILTLGANNIGIDDVVVDLAITNGPGSSSEWGYIDGSVISGDGIASARYQSPLTTGTITIEAYVRSVTDFSIVTTSYTTITVLAPSLGGIAGESEAAYVADIIVNVDPSTITLGATTQARISATAIDSLGHVLRDLTIFFDIPAATAVSGSVEGSARPGVIGGAAVSTYNAPISPIVVPVVVTAGAVQKSVSIAVTTETVAQPVQEATQRRVETLLFSSQHDSLGIGGVDSSLLNIATLDSNNNPVHDVVVTAYISAGPGSSDEWGYISLGSDGATVNGLLTGSYTSGLTTGTVTLTADVRSVTDSTVLVTRSITVDLELFGLGDANQIRVASILMSRSAQGGTDNLPVLSNRANAATVFATALDANGAVIAGGDVEFVWDLVAGPGAPSNWGSLTNQGAQIAFHSAGTGTVTVRASVRSLTTGAIWTSSTYNLTVVDSLIANLNFQAANLVPANSSTTLRVTATDTQGLYVDLSPYSIEYEILSATDVSGYVQTFGGSNPEPDYYSGTYLGPVDIRVTVGGISKTVTINVVDANYYTELVQQSVVDLVMVPSVNTINTFGSVGLSLLPLDSNNQLIRNAQISIELVSGPGASSNWGYMSAVVLGEEEDSTPAATYSMPLLPGVVGIQAYVRSVTDYSIIATAYTAITVVDPGVGANTALATSISLIVQDSVLTPNMNQSTNVSALVRDAQGHVVDDVYVAYEILSPTPVSGAIQVIGNGYIAPGGVFALAQYYAGTTPGVIAIRATVGAVSAVTTVTLANIVDDSEDALAANIILMASASEVAPGIDNEVDLRAIAVDAQGQVLEKVTFDFDIPAATAVSGAVLETGFSTGNIFTGTYFPGSATGVVTIRARVGAVSQTVNILVTNTPNATPIDNTVQNSVAYLVLMADSASLVPGSGDTAAITAWAMDSNNNPVEGAQVDVYLAAGPTGNQGNWGSVGANIQTSAQGLGTVDYRAGLAAGTVTIRADVRTFDTLALVTSTTVDIALSPASTQSQEAQIAAIIVDADPRVLERGVANQSDIFMMAVDAVGNVLTEVDFDVTIVGADAVSGAVQGLAVPDATGVASSKYYAGSETGTVTISVTAGAVTQTIALSIVENLADDTAIQELVQQSVQYVVLSSDVFMLDAGFDQYASLSIFAIGSGNVPVADARVELQILSGPGGIANQSQWGIVESPVITDASGLADALYAASSVTGTVTIRASIKSVLTGATITSTTLDLTIMESDLQQQIDAAAYLVLSATPGLLELNGDDIESTISALVIDSNGHALDQVPVTIDILTGPGGASARGTWGAVYPATMVKSGITNTATYAMGTTTGTITLIAYAGAISSTIDLVISNNPNIDAASIAQDALHADVTYLLLTSSAASANTGSTNSVVFTATAMNANNNPLNGVAVDFAVIGHTGTASPALWGSIQGPLNTAGGRANATYTASAVTGTVTVEATVYSVINPAVVYAVTTATLSLVEGTALTNSELLVSSIVLESTLLSVEQGLQHSAVVRAAPIDSLGRVLRDVPLYLRIVNGPSGTPQDWGIVEGSALVPVGDPYAEARYFGAAVTGIVELEIRAGSITRTINVRVDPSVTGTDTNGNVIMTSGDIILTSNRSLVAEGISHTLTLTALAFGTNNQPVPAGTNLDVRIVSHSSTSNQALWGVVQPLASGTDADGVMEIRYFASLATGTVVIEVFSGTITQQISIDVVEDEPSFLGVTVVPGTLEADGTSQADVVVTALDIYGDPVPDGTRITLSLGYVDFGYLSSSVVETSAGQVTVQYTAPLSGGVDGTQTILANLGTVTASRQIQIIDLRVTTVGVLAQPQTLEIGQQGYILATLRDVLGQPVEAGTGVTFAASSTHVTLLNSFAPSDVSGIAQITIVADAVTSSVEITAYVYGVAGLMTDSTIISIQPPASGTISYVSASPTVVGVRGASSFGNGVIQETSVITFRVETSYGQSVPDGTVVDFQIDGPVGAVLLQSSATTLNGIVTTTVRSGTVSGTIRVLAEVDFAGTPFFAWSAPVGVQAGPPVQNHISVAFGYDQNGWAISVPGKQTKGYAGKVGAYLSDRFNNPVPEGTQVYFTTEAGIIQANASTDSLGRVEVDYVTNNPEPTYLGVDRDLAVAPFGPASAGAYAYQREVSASANSGNTILLVAIGEESFSDLNGNGIYDMGEPVGDTSEPYLDNNSDGIRNNSRTYLDDLAQSISVPAEPFWDYDEDGTFDLPNGTWDSRGFVWSTAENIWFGTPAAGYVLPSRFIDMNADGQYHQDDDLILYGNDLTFATLLCGAPLNVTAATQIYTGDLRIDFVSQDADGMLPGGWGIESMTVAIEIALDLSITSFSPTSNVVLTQGDAYSNRHRALVTAGALGSEIPYGIDRVQFNRVSANAAAFNDTFGATVCRIPD